MTGKITIIFRLEPLRLLPTDDNGENAAHSPVLFAGSSGIDPEALRKKGLVVELTIMEIDSFELRSAHAFSQNSPFVSVSCGKFTDTTKEITSGGSTAYWTNLQWTFRMKDDTSIRLLVGSKDKTIGTGTVLPQTVFSTQPDAKGLCKVLI